MTETPTFATCTYQEFDPSYGIPIKSTLGHPRFKLRYTLAGNWPQAAPERAWFNADKETFRDNYWAKLEQTGVAKFQRMALDMNLERGVDLSVDGDEKTIVLLCFDKLWIPETWCHRTMFGEWWLEQTGEDVPEYGRTAHHGTKPIPVPEGLF